jgi:O-succinylbenzoic acid--CoA ligase
VIEWLRRNDPGSIFLEADDRVWTYAEAAAEVERRMKSEPGVCMPGLTPEDVFQVLAGIGGGGVTVVGPGQETTAPADADLVVFTSGTSGPPKGVRLSRSNLEAAARASALHLGHGAEDRWLLAMPLHHVGGLSIVVRQAYTGGSVTLLDHFEPQTFAMAMRGDITMVSVVPTMLRRLIPFGPFHGLRGVLVGGGPIPDGLLEDAVAVGLPALPTYGMTETFGQVATLLPGTPTARRAHPLPGVDLRVRPDGRVAVRGDQVSAGYVGEADRDDPWLVTNDLGEIDEDGAVHILGRADTVIVTGGENVSPERVEAALRAIPGVDEAVVVGVPDVEWGRLVACAFSGAADPENLRYLLADSLPAWMIPKRFVAVTAIPRTSIGKPDRSAVEAFFEE